VQTRAQAVESAERLGPAPERLQRGFSRRRRAGGPEKVGERVAGSGARSLGHGMEVTPELVAAVRGVLEEDQARP